MNYPSEFPALQIADNEPDHFIDLVLGQLIFKGRHREFAVFDLLINFGLAFFRSFAVPQARDEFSADLFAVGLLAVTDCTVLAKKRGFVGFTVADDKLSLIASFRTSHDKKSDEQPENKNLSSDGPLLTAHYLIAPSMGLDALA